ncbi:MarR family transcriptional regulator [Bacillus sp. FJAT-42376]|uniref:MarR family winged helix-turn-helix transcriptional regulator n=1 Tax=Bacillus sp. FJAT-42376 TaxID=2014076 RepID=UPI000F51146D|nr:MarR family transcriptional regulator [Bacillus sp. FJAT-42376]AZB44083.1 MarR family transcriptional regulator [Bacillus sp. FJAT-42376]
MKNNLNKQLERLDEIKDTLFMHKRQLIEMKIKELPYSLTPTKYHILKFVYNQRKCKVADISHKLYLTSGATTTLLNQLEDDLLLKRARDQNDRRIVWIVLTDQGDQFVSAMIEQRNIFWAEMLSVLDEEEREEYFRILNKIEAGILSSKRAIQKRN